MMTQKNHRRDVPRSWNRRREIILLAVLAAAALLPGCASTVSVHSVRPQTTYQQLGTSVPLSGQLSPSTVQVLRMYGLSAIWRSDPATALSALDHLPRKTSDVLFATIELSQLRASRERSPTSKRAAGLYMDTAERAWSYLFRWRQHHIDPAFDAHAFATILAYDDATARIVESLFKLWKEPASGWTIPMPDGRTVTLGMGHGRWRFSEFRSFSAVDRLHITGFRNRFTRFGLGAPFVGLIPPGYDPPDRQLFPPKGLAVPVTAVILFPKAGPADHHSLRCMQLVLLDPRKRDSLRVGTRVVPTAADFTAPYGYLAALGERDIRRIGSQGMFSPAATRSLHRIILMEPYDSSKIPLVLVHGLWSNPSIWLPLTNALQGDPLLRSKYQVWYFLYPSGEPFLWTAAMFRDSLDRVRDLLDPSHADPAMNAMVLVGHSMGGLLVKTTVSTSGHRLWNTIFRVPPGRLPVARADAARIEKALFFAPKPYVHRVIFLSTPQHGSRLAASIVGEIGSALVQLPHSFSSMLRRIARNEPAAISPRMRALFRKGGADAIRALRPDNPVMKAFTSLPISPDVPYHTIIGDRGLDGGANASDGIVSFRSAHLAGAASETIVPCDHHSTTNPQAIAEILRILRENLEHP